MLAPEFVSPALELRVDGFATYRTSASEWLQFNRTVATFNGISNPGAGRLVIDSRPFAPRNISAPHRFMTPVVALVASAARRSANTHAPDPGW
jgi:hypothetical protein